MKIGVVTDSASDATYEWADKHNVPIVPMNVTFNGQSYKEDRSFDLDGYYENFVTQKLFQVKTSQPSPGDFHDAYQKLVDEGYDQIICVTVSSGLSGTYNSAYQAAKMINDESDSEVFVVDSKSASYGVFMIVEYAVELVAQGKSAPEIVEALNDRVARITTTLILPTLKYLRAGGRVSMPKFLIGNLLGLKPITQLNEDGVNEAIGTTRNMLTGVQKVYDLNSEGGAKKAVEHAIAHTNDLDLANRLKDIIEANEPGIPVRIVKTASAISAHAGPGALGFFSRFE